jgi:hypothetical protein
LKVEHAAPPAPFSLPIPLDAGASAALALAAGIPVETGCFNPVLV